MLFGSLNNFLRVHRGSWNQKLENYPSINLRSPGVAFPKHHQFFGGLLIRLTTENLLTNNLVSHTHHLYSPTKTLTYKPVSPGIFITWGGRGEELPREISTEPQYIIPNITWIKVKLLWLKWGWYFLPPVHPFP